MRRHVDLVAELAGETHPHEPRRNAADARLAQAHMRHGFVRKIHAFDEGGDCLPRARPLHGDRRPLLGGRGEPDPEIGELGLEIILHMREHAGRAAGGRRHVEAIGLQARDHAVVHEETGLAQHEAVAAAANLELLEGVGVHAFEKRRRIGTDDFDLAERGGVEQPDAGAGRAAFARDRVVHRFVAHRKIPGPLP